MEKNVLSAPHSNVIFDINQVTKYVSICWLYFVSLACLFSAFITVAL